MAFDNSGASRSAARRNKKELILGVGGHAFVNWPHASQAVPVVDASASAEANGLTDGQEVEVLSWRPRSREGLIYQIRSLADDREWWILAAHLRRSRVPEPVAPAATEVEVVERAEARSARSAR